MGGCSPDLPELVGLVVFASGSGRLSLLLVAVACFRSIGFPSVGASIACCSFARMLGLGHEINPRKFNSSSKFGFCWI